MLRQFIERLLGPTPWDSSDRRRKLRVKVHFALEIIFPTFITTGTAVDMGPTGIKVKIPADRDPMVMKGQMVRLKYVPPQFKGLHTIECQARWLSKEGDKKFVLGLVFDDSGVDVRKSWVPGVKTLVNEQQSVGDRKQLRVETAIDTRFKVDDQERNGQLRDLSSSGGLLETSRHYSEGTRMELTLLFKPPHAPVTLEAVVCRSQTQKTTSHLGLVFLTTDKQKRFLQNLVKAIVALQNKDEASATS